MNHGSSRGRPGPAAPARGTGSPAWRLWGWPVLLGLLTASGLVSALLSEASGDAWSWFALGAPVGVMAWFGLRRPPRGVAPNTGP